MIRNELDPKKPPDLRLVRLAVLIGLIVVVVAWTTADPDLWGHVLFGRDIVATRGLPSADPYSFTSDRPWVNHEWLAEVVMYAAFRAGGPSGLVYLKTLVVCVVLACIVTNLRRRRIRSTDHDLLLAVALFGMFPRYHPVRPQLFSLLLFALLLVALVTAERGNRRALFGVPAIFAAWANLHGGFLVGLGVLLVWLVATFVATPARWRSLAAVGIASAAATLVTPYGVELWVFLWQTVGLSRPEILDWRPALTSGAPVLIPWALVMATAVFALARVRAGGATMPSIAIVVALALGSAKVGRIDAFFAIAVVMLLGPVFGTARRPDAARNPSQPWAIGIAALLALGGVAALGRRGACLEMSGYPEPQAIDFLRGHEGRMVTLFGWGQYAIWHVGPRLKVSMDGRRETVYSESMINRHLRLYEGEPGSTALVRDLSPDLIWLPVRSPAVAMLEREGWKPAFQGPVSVVLTAHAVPAVQQVAQQTPNHRCFPSQ